MSISVLTNFSGLHGADYYTYYTYYTATAAGLRGSPCAGPTGSGWIEIVGQRH